MKKTPNKSNVTTARSKYKIEDEGYQRQKRNEERRKDEEEKKRRKNEKRSEEESNEEDEDNIFDEDTSKNKFKKTETPKANPSKSILKSEHP